MLRESWQDGQRVCVPALPPSDAPPVPVMQRYGQLQTLQQKRLAARRHKTSYCYDFPAVFATALRGMWEAHAVATGAVQPSGAMQDITKQALLYYALFAISLTVVVVFASTCHGLSKYSALTW